MRDYLNFSEEYKITQSKSVRPAINRAGESALPGAILREEPSMPIESRMQSEWCTWQEGVPRIHSERLSQFQ